MNRGVTRIWILSVVLAACGDAGKRPLGAECGDDSECEAGLCISGLCLDPDADDDVDGLTNRIEGALGSNPRNPDSDGDGVADGDEIGVDLANPADGDGDGKFDALESSSADSDGDCIPDQRDPNDAATEADPIALAKALCLNAGVCARGVVASCAAGAATCDYAQVEAFEATELACDGRDNDCDGATDERHAQGGEVAFGGGPYAVDAGKVLGDACGVGACAGGTVICAPDAATLVCSTNDRVGALACDSDMDCDGIADETEVDNPITDPLAGCVDFYADADADGHGAGAGRCLCSPFGAYQVANRDDCAEADPNRYPMAPGICGVDADCDERLQDVGEACDDDNTDVTDGCNACTIVARRVDAGVAEMQYMAAPRVAAVGTGFVVAWDAGSDLAGNRYGRALAFFDASGAEVHREVGLGLDERDYYSRADLATLPEGLVAVGTWRLDIETGGWFYEVQRYDATGATSGKPARVYEASEPFYEVSLVSVGGGALVFALVDQVEGYTIVMRRIDRDSNTRDGGGRAIANGGNLEVIGFDDGTVVASWVDYDPDTFAETHLTQRFDADGKPIGEPRAFVAPDVEVVATKLARRGAGWALFFIGQTYDGETFHAPVGYQAYEGDAPIGALIFLEEDDTQGCPYEVLGGFDAAGYAWAAVPDGECRSPLRGWYAGATTVPLTIFDEALHPGSYDSDGWVESVGTGFAAAFVVSDGAYPGLYLMRYGAGGVPVR